MTTDFWYNDISVLFNKKYLLEVIPLRTYSLSRKLNACLRLSIYYSIIMYLYNRETQIFCLPFIVLVITVYIYRTNTKQSEEDNMDDLMNTNMNDTTIIELDNMVDKINNDKYRQPTVNNPMMNILTNTSEVEEDIEAIPTYNNLGVASLVDDKLETGLYRDSNDLFNRSNSQRQFYTMPNTEPMNRQTEFAKWCYMTPPTCKEGNGIQCAANLHNRLNRNSADGFNGSKGHGGGVR